MGKFRKGEIVRQRHGRAPWYDMNGVPIDAYVIGIAGGSASGKTSVAQSILEQLEHIPTVLILSQDSFYRKHTQEEIDLAFNSELDLDHPDAIDTDLFVKCLTSLKKGKATEIPVYSFVHHQRMPEKKYLYGASVIIVEGIMTMCSKELRDLFDLKVFVNADPDLMLARRIRRDIAERGRDVEGVLTQYLRFVKDSYDNFVLPSSKFSDIIVPGASNHVAIDLIVTHIRRQLDARSLRFRNKLSQIQPLPVSLQDAENQGIPENAILLDQTSQLKGIMTILRDRETERGEFIFHADRLSSLVVEMGLSMVPYRDATVTTPLHLEFRGKEIAAQDIVGVSVLRSGGPFARGLRRVIRDVQLGSLLIQSDPRTGEPLLFHCSFPDCIKDPSRSSDAIVFLLDSQVGTGAAALMGVRVLLDHGVQEHNIILLTFLVAHQGLNTVRRAFPGVRVVTAAIDPILTERAFPMDEHTVVGSAAGDGDFATRITPLPPIFAQDGGESIQALEARLDRLRFSRPSQVSTPAEGRQKRAWVIEPGMGHIGDRYYLK